MIRNIPKRYKIISNIGKGGMANIYLAYDNERKHNVAIKQLSSESSTNKVSVKRFEDEMELMAQIHSEYIVKIIDFQNEPDSRFIVMEYVDGQTLKQYIEYRTNIVPDQAVYIAKQLALGLHEMHKHGIIHRDIKSQNILIANDGRVKIIDLGIALGNDTSRVTQTNRLIGSVQYVAPELINKQPPSAQSDVYALGIILYEMLVGNVPFEGTDPMKVLLEHNKKTVPNAKKEVSSIPQSLANIIAQATAKNLAIRYKSAAEMYNSLKTALDPNRIDEPVFDPTTGKVHVEKNPFVEFLASKWGILSMSALFFGITIIAILVLLFTKVF